jgi:glycosyltransferase involved in cell wall biosynthesis
MGLERRGVLFVGHEATRTGAPIALLHFLRWLKKNGKRPFAMILAEGGELTPEFEALGEVWCRERGVWSARGLRRRALGAAGFRDLGQRLERADAGRWVARQAPALIYVNSIASASAVQMLPPGIPTITHVHELEYSFRQLEGPALSGLLHRTRQFIACSNAVRENLVRGHGVPPDRVETVYESIPVEQVRPGKTRQEVFAELRIPSGHSLVIGCGAHNWRKGADLFIQVAMTVSKRRSDVHFTWIGGLAWEMAQLELDVQRAGLVGKMSLPGVVTNAADYFAAADVFVLTSREDPYPLVCLEAAALGKPIVCFANAGGIPEFVEEDCGYIVPYLDVNAMAERVVELLDLPERRRSMGEAACKKVAERHDVSMAAPRIAQIIETTIAEAKGR